MNTQTFEQLFHVPPSTWIDFPETFHDTVEALAEKHPFSLEVVRFVQETLQKCLRIEADTAPIQRFHTLGSGIPRKVMADLCRLVLTDSPMPQAKDLKTAVIAFLAAEETVRDSVIAFYGDDPQGQVQHGTFRDLYQIAAVQVTSPEIRGEIVRPFWRLWMNIMPNGYPEGEINNPNSQRLILAVRSTVFFAGLGDSAAEQLAKQQLSAMRVRPTLHLFGKTMRGLLLEQSPRLSAEFIEYLNTLSF